MNLPNKLSLLRIILIPITLVFMLPISIYGWEPTGWNNFITTNGWWVAAIFFIIASITDFLDGKIARKHNLVTNLGKFLDPLADKVLVISVLCAFCYLGRVSAWPLVIIIFREFMVSGIRLVASSQGVVMAAKMLGKIKTVTQMIAIIYLLFEPLIHKIFGTTAGATNAVTIVGDVLLLICVIMTIVSGVDYLVKNLEFIKE